MNVLPHFPWKWFQLRHSNICKKLKNTLFKRLQHSFLSSRLLQNHFLRRFLCPNFDLNRFEHVASLSQKMVSIRKKLAKNWKMLFSNVQNFRVLPGCFETTSWNAYHDHLWIKRLLNALPSFHSKRFQLLGLRMCEKLKISFFKGSVVHLLLTSR